MSIYPRENKYLQTMSVQDAMPTMKPGTYICIKVMAYSPAFAVRPEYCTRDNPKCSGIVIDTVGGASIVVWNSRGGQSGQHQDLG